MSNARKKGTTDDSEYFNEDEDPLQEPQLEGDDEVYDAVEVEPSDVPVKVDDGVDADATAAAIEAAVVAAASVTVAHKENAAAASASAIVQDALIAPRDRDVILGDGSAGHKTTCCCKI